MTKPSPSVARIVRVLIRWRQRVQGGLVRAADLVDANTQQAFLAEFRRQRRDLAVHLPDDDALNALDHLIGDRTGCLLDWWRIAFGVDVHAALLLDGIEPRIRLDYQGRWESLCNDLDPDTLICIAMNRRWPERSGIELVHAMSGWSTVTRAASTAVEQMSAHGVSDLHIHVGGTRQPIAGWLRLLRADQGRVRPALREILWASGGESKVGDRDTQDFIADVIDARRARDELIVQLRLEDEARLHELPPASWTAWEGENHRRERLLLACAIRGIRQLQEQELSASSGQLEGVPQSVALMRVLDRYLLGKTAFLARTRQPMYVGSPGLSTFDGRYFGATRQSAGRVLRAGLRSGRHGRLMVRDILTAVTHQFEPPAMRRLELRIAPDNPCRPPDIERKFCLLDRGIEELNAGSEAGGSHTRGRITPESLRFTVHFKRSIPTRPQEDIGDRAVRVLARYLRESAGYRATLNTYPDGKTAKWLGRIDVAGQERTLPSWYFGPVFRLLRGSREVEQWFSMISRSDCPDLERVMKAGAQWWMALSERGTITPAPGIHRLGGSFHAGEDFCDVLEGLFQIWGAVIGSDLQPGDTIGHGLALATCPIDFCDRTSRHIYAPAGNQLDSAAWLLALMREHGNEGWPVGAASDLEACIEALASDVWGPVASGGADKAVQLFSQRWSDPFGLFAQDGDLRGRLRAYWTESGLGRYLKQRPLHERRTTAAVLEAVKMAQKFVVKKLVEREVVVETNPYSNIRIGGVHQLRLNPSLSVLELAEQGLGVCINTDNPGIFVSRIENEYTSLLVGAQQSGWSSEKCRDLLEAARRAGMELVWWPPATTHRAA